MSNLTRLLDLLDLEYEPIGRELYPKEVEIRELRDAVRSELAQAGAPNPPSPSQELIRAGDAMERSIEFSTHQEEGDPCDGCGYDYGKGHSFGCHINGLKDAAAAWRSAKQSGFTPSTQ